MVGMGTLLLTLLPEQNPQRLASLGSEWLRAASGGGVMIYDATGSVQVVTILWGIFFTEYFRGFVLGYDILCPLSPRGAWKMGFGNSIEMSGSCFCFCRLKL